MHDPQFATPPAGLSASVFWSLQTLVYLHLRWGVDSTDANELAGATDAEPAAASPPTPTAGRSLLTTLALMGLMAATWVVTARLFARLGGENAGWLGWGVGDRFRPDADGLYFFASLLAAGWGFLWVTAPVAVALRRALRPDDRPEPPVPG